MKKNVAWIPLNAMHSPYTFTSLCIKANEWLFITKTLFTFSKCWLRLARSCWRGTRLCFLFSFAWTKRQERDLLFHMTQPIIIRYNAKSHHAKSNQFSVEIRMNESTVAEELTNVNSDCHCVTKNWWKTMQVLVTQNPVWNILTSIRKQLLKK